MESFYTTYGIYSNYYNNDNSNDENNNNDKEDLNGNNLNIQLSIIPRVIKYTNNLIIFPILKNNSLGNPILLDHILTPVDNDKAILIPNEVSKQTISRIKVMFNITLNIIDTTETVIFTDKIVNVTICHICFIDNKLTLLDSQQKFFSNLSTNFLLQTFNIHININKDDSTIYFILLYAENIDYPKYQLPNIDIYNDLYSQLSLNYLYISDKELPWPDYKINISNVEIYSSKLF